jgi:hypothetical protein
LREFLPHENLVTHPFDSPARDGVERRRAEGFSRAQAETGMMPRASHGVPNDETLGKRPVVMSALCADRENLVTAAHQDHVFAIDLTESHRSISEIANRTSVSKIGFLSLFRFCHFYAQGFIVS